MTIQSRLPTAGRRTHQHEKNEAADCFLVARPSQSLHPTHLARLVSAACAPPTTCMLSKPRLVLLQFPAHAQPAPAPSTPVMRMSRPALVTARPVTCEPQDLPGTSPVCPMAHRAL